MVLSHSNLARSLVPLSVPESHGGGRSNKVVERTAGRPARQKNMADSLWPGGSSWQHVAIAGNVPNEGKNYEAEICQRGSEAFSPSVQATSFPNISQCDHRYTWPRKWPLVESSKPRRGKPSPNQRDFPHKQSQATLFLLRS